MRSLVPMAQRLGSTEPILSDPWNLSPTGFGMKRRLATSSCGRGRRRHTWVAIPTNHRVVRTRVMTPLPIHLRQTRKSTKKITPVVSSESIRNYSRIIPGPPFTFLSTFSPHFRLLFGRTFFAYLDVCSVRRIVVVRNLAQRRRCVFLNG
jgi:hypothetical protein